MTRAYCLKQVFKKATRTTAETNILIDHIVTAKKHYIADCGITPCSRSDHDHVYVIRHASFSQIKEDPKIVTDRNTRNLDNDKLIKDLKELPFDLTKAPADNSNDLWLISKSFFLSILNKHAPIKTIRVMRNNLPLLLLRSNE